MMRRTIAVLTAVVALASGVALAANPETFGGSPSAPTSYRPTGWDIAVHSRDINTWETLEPMEADHSAACGAPPASHHQSGSYADAVFQCSNHLMTSIKATGYGAIYLTPDQQVDFSSGEAVVRWDMSTLRTSSRDWADVWITPYEDNLQLPLDNWLTPDLQGQPKRAVHVRTDQGVFSAETIANFTAQLVPGKFPGNSGASYDVFLTPSSARRDTFEIRLSRTHLKVGMPAYNFWWIDRDIADLGWDSGVVQFGHHSYTPEKDCNVANIPGPDGQCRANTWHWDNVQISPALPFGIVPLAPRLIQGQGQTVTFPGPAPAGSRLRFSAVGITSLSFDGGVTYQQARWQESATHNAGHFSSYFHAVPTGATGVRFRFAPDDWQNGPFAAKDFALWTEGDVVVPPTTTATPTSTGVPPTATTVPTATSTPVVSATPTPVPSTATPAATATLGTTGTICYRSTDGGQTIRRRAC